MNRSALLLLWLAASPALASGKGIVPLSPAVGDTVSAAEAERWGLFPDVSGLRWAVFVPGNSGGFTARLSVAGDPPGAVRERYIPREVWEEWRRRMDAGERVTAAKPPAAPDGVWPEVPLPPPPEKPANPPAGAPGEGGPPGEGPHHGPSGRWLFVVDLGVKHPTTRFRDYFTDMFESSFALGLPLGRHFIASFGLQAAVGDLPDAFEKLTANGRSTHYAIELGGDVLLPAGASTDLVVGLRGGYYMRALRWGGALFWGYNGLYQSGSLVRELSNWGGGARLGLRHVLGDPARRRWLDVSLHYETYAADPTLLENPESGLVLSAGDRDTWVGLTVGMVLGI